MYIGLHTHPETGQYEKVWATSMDGKCWTYNGHFATKLVLDLALFDSTRRLLLDYGEELFDTHGDVGYLSSLLAKDLTVSNSLYFPVS